MNDRRYTVIFGVAVLTAGLATAAVYHTVATAGTTQPSAMRAVVIATADVPTGMPIDAQSLTVVRWPASAAPAEGFATTDSLVGRVTREPLVSGSPVLSGSLAPKGAAAGYEGAITAGNRAVSIRVNEATGVSGLVRRDSRVDVLVTVRDDQRSAPTAWVVANDIRVLGVGAGRGGTPGTGAVVEPLPTAAVTSVVTLEVTPADAARLVAAETQGSIQLVLRGYGATDSSGASYNVASAPMAPAAVAVAPSRVQVAQVAMPRVIAMGAPGALPPGALPGTGRTGARTGVGRTAESVAMGRGGSVPRPSPTAVAQAVKPMPAAPAAAATAEPARAVPGGRVVEVTGGGADRGASTGPRVYRGGKLVGASTATPQP